MHDVDSLRTVTFKKKKARHRAFFFLQSECESIEVQHLQRPEHICEYWSFQCGTRNIRSLARRTV